MIEFLSDSQGPNLGIRVDGRVTAKDSAVAAVPPSLNQLPAYAYGM